MPARSGERSYHRAAIRSVTTDDENRFMTQTVSSTTNRRNFLNTTAGAGAAALMVHSSVAAQEKQHTLRIGVVGCGGRGTGAVDDSLSINENVLWSAAADVYPENCASKANQITRRHPEKMDLPADRMYGGLDGYKRILDDPQIDVVIMTTPPGFRPYYILEAIQAGKHVFAEKPTCVDVAGYRVCLEAHELALSKGLGIVTGTQYRRQTNYVGAIEQIRAGAIGDIVSAVSRYCADGIWYRPRKEGMSDVEYQIYNWMHFIWLSGDQIAEQAVHNIDVMNWVMGGPPEEAYGSGGRFTRPEDSQMWDNMAIDYVYPGDRLLSFMCRQIPRTDGYNNNVIYGTQGTCHIAAGNGGSKILDRTGKEIWSMKGSISQAYQQEHKDLIDSIRAGQPIVELKETADSSLTAVMGRLTAYSGRRVTWEFLTQKSTLDLFPKDLDWAGTLPEVKYAIPGQSELS
ncbi:MAG: Gfo/Idh/MocA family oxidoreductase [Pirellulaceae bacterium]|nr:Gfo/Idh/MocA family oxidoreductase [Pirellulaceae bacterium]